MVPNLEGGEAVAPETPGAEVATQTAPGSAPGSKEVPEKTAENATGDGDDGIFLRIFGMEMELF